MGLFAGLESRGPWGVSPQTLTACHAARLSLKFIKPGRQFSHNAVALGVGEQCPCANLITRAAASIAVAADGLYGAHKDAGGFNGVAAHIRYLG